MRISLAPPVAALLFALPLALPPTIYPQSPAPPPNNFYVSTTGNDHNPGTQAKPFATLAAARDAIRALRARGVSTSGATVWIHGGLYPLPTGFALDAHDSGEPTRPIVWRAEPNQQPRFFGGAALDATKFTPITDPSLQALLRPEARGHVLQLKLGSGIAGPQRYADIFKGNGGMVQLIWDGHILPLSRWPKKSYTTMESVIESGITPPRGGTFHYRPEVNSHADQWAAAAKAGRLWLNGFWRVPFETESVRVANVDVTNRTITLAAAVPQGIGSKYVAIENGTRHGDGKEQYYAFNLLEEISEPGEWSYDFNSQTLYLWPPNSSGKTSHEVLLANLSKPVVTLDGTSHVELRGLTIEGGLVQGVLIKGGNDDRIAGTLIRNTGGGGIDVTGGASNTIQSNDLEHIGDYGIRLVAGDRKNLIPGNLIADNNHIHNFGEQNLITDGIYLDGVGNRATHNLIHDGPYNGIRYQGNDQYMGFNEIHHIGLGAGDLGAFYTNGDWAAQGNVIEYNFAHHSPNANGSYVDDGASGRKTVGNIFYKLSVGPFLGGGHNNITENNLIIACKTGIHVDDRGIARHYDTTAHHLTDALKTIDPNRPPWSTRYPNFLQSILADPTRPTGNIFRNNVILETPTPYQLASPNILDPAQNPALKGDPGFTDEATLNFTLRPGSPIFSALPQFKAIPFAEIGLKLDQFRTRLPTDAETGRNVDRSESQFFDSNTDIKASDRLAKP